MIYALQTESQDFMIAAIALCLGEIGKHNKELSDALANQDVLKELLVFLVGKKRKEGFRFTSKK